MSSQNTLPSKEQALFKRVVKCYEQKQYKNGLKFAKQILNNSKFSEHGETLAMKGLILNCLGKKDEAIDYVHRGLKNDVRSYVCWHVYGMLQLFDKKYDEAIKCYRNALRIDQDQVQILKDLSKILIHVRELEGFRDTRYKLLTLRPTQQNSWIGLALGEHLLNNYDMALDVLDEYVKTQNITSINYEHSELLIYQNYVMQEAGRLQDALNHLIKNENMICDKLFILENKASILVKLGKTDEAVAVYWELLCRNTDNKAYYEGLENALKPSKIFYANDLGYKKVIVSISERMHIYKKANELNPYALFPMKIPLEFTTGAQFEGLLDTFLQKNLRKGVPSLFRAIKDLYRDPEKVQIIQKLILGYTQNLEDYNKLDKESDTEPESPSTTLWTLILLARHWDHMGNYGEALDVIQRAILHTPTFIDSYVTKAKIYKHAGDMMRAAELMDQAQSLDTADRFINCKCTKYMLRANMMQPADDMCSRFTKEGTVPSEDLNDMQCMWYLTESALAYQRLGNYGEALKKCHQIGKHFGDMLEDQFDFHTYCPRKMTLYSYVKMLKLEDKTLYNNSFYLKVAICAGEIYLKLFDNPSLAHYDPKSTSADKSQGLGQNPLDSLHNGDNVLNASELKKLRNKQRKAEKKNSSLSKDGANPTLNKVPSSQHTPASQTNTTNSNEKKETVDSVALATTSKPLDEALNFLLPFLKHNDQNMQMHWLAFEIYYRKKKKLLMLRALKKMRNLDQRSPLFHECQIKFLRAHGSDTSKAYEPSMHDLVTQQLNQLSICPNSDIGVMNDRFLAENNGSLAHVISGTKMMVFIDPLTRVRALDIITNHLEQRNSKNDMPSILDCIKGLLLVQELTQGDKSLSEYLHKYKQYFGSLFPLCDIETILHPSPDNKCKIGSGVDETLPIGETCNGGSEGVDYQDKGHSYIPPPCTDDYQSFGSKCEKGANYIPASPTNEILVNGDANVEDEPGR